MESNRVNSWKVMYRSVFEMDEKKGVGFLYYWGVNLVQSKSVFLECLLCSRLLACVNPKWDEMQMKK